MFFAQDKDAANRNLLISIIESAIKGDSVLAPVIDEILVESHEFATGSKDIFQIDSEYVEYVLLFVRASREYFANLDPKRPTERDYRFAIDILKNKNTLEVAAG